MERGHIYLVHAAVQINAMYTYGVIITQMNANVRIHGMNALICNLYQSLDSVSMQSITVRDKERLTGDPEADAAANARAVTSMTLLCIEISTRILSTLQRY